jgi:hypothetical protein
VLAPPVLLPTVLKDENDDVDLATPTPPPKLAVKGEYVPTLKTEMEKMRSKGTRFLLLVL